MRSSTRKYELPFGASGQNGLFPRWTNANIALIPLQKEGMVFKRLGHGLKTPVTSIKGYVQLLLMMIEDKKEVKAPPEFRTSLVRIENQVWQLSRMISDMIDLGGIDKGTLKIKHETFCLNELLDTVVQNIGAIMPNGVVSVMCDKDIYIQGDKARLYDVLMTLLTNAIKYSPASEPVELSIHQATKKSIAISVKDRGIGIEKKEHKKIFRRFYRIPGKDNETYPGLGIGLYIAQKIIKKHQGEIGVESEKGKGATFTFVLPTAVQTR